MRTTIPLTLTAATLLIAAQARAQGLAYNYPSTLVGNEPAAQTAAGPYDAGNIFTVNSPILVNQLGLFSSGANPNPFGVAQTCDVGIYSVTISQNELITATLVGSTASFSAGSPGALSPGTSTLVKGISNLLLNPGLYMVAVDSFAGPGNLPYFDNQHAPVNSASANTAGGYLSFSGSFLDDNNLVLGGSISDLANWGYLDPGANNTPRLSDANFGFTPVPEPNTISMGVLVFLGITIARRFEKVILLIKRA